MLDRSIACSWPSHTRLCWLLDVDVGLHGSDECQAMTSHQEVKQLKFLISLQAGVWTDLWAKGTVQRACRMTHISALSSNVIMLPLLRSFNIP